MHKNVSPKNLSLKEPETQYDIRSDGIVVKLRCPKCGADKFRSNLGFQNHCRLQCKLIFSSTEDRIQRCGVEVANETISKTLVNTQSSSYGHSLKISMINAESLNESLQDFEPEYDAANLHLSGEDSDRIDSFDLVL